MIQAAVITAVYDAYDTLKPVCPQNGADVEWICVTDSEGLADQPPEGWTVVHEPRPGLHPNRAAKHPKMFPWIYTSSPASVWVDASFRVTSPDFVTGALSHAESIAQFAHPWRNCVYEEAVESALLPKYVGEDFVGQIDAYRSAGHPDNWGLWATGVIARHHTPQTQSLGFSWMYEIERFTYQDQVSEPVALRNVGLRPDSLPGTHFSNPWLSYEGSGRH